MSIPASRRRDCALRVAEEYLLRPYRWGGQGVRVDCSGLIVECLRASGDIGPDDDFSAQGLHSRSARQSVASAAIQRGDLLFFGGGKGRVTHVGIAVDPYYMIEAGGGDSRTTSDEAAERMEAIVRIRPISARRDLVDVCRIW